MDYTFAIPRILFGPGPSTGSRPERSSATMLKSLFLLYPNELLHLMNYSIANAWTHSPWKCAKATAITKKTLSWLSAQLPTPNFSHIGSC